MNRSASSEALAEYTITIARCKDLEWLPGIELAAAPLLAGHVPATMLGETTSVQVFEHACRDGHLWVALAHDRPVGFAQVKVLEPTTVHLEEIDVHPEHGRRGLGTRLVMAVCAWASRHGYQGITLTTFRDVPFNMPFYARLGFGVISRDELSASLRAIVDNEELRGLDSTRRVVMRRSSTLLSAR